MADGARTLKRLNLELGGITPAIVLQDADIERTLPVLVKAGMVFAGQQCVAISRILVHRARLDEFAHRLADRLAKLVVGPGSSPGTEMGPLIDVANRDRVAALVRGAAVDHEVLLQGGIPEGAPEGSAFLRPSLVRLRGRETELTREERAQMIRDLNAAETKVLEKYGVSQREWARSSINRSRDQAEAVKQAAHAQEAREKADAEKAAAAKKDEGREIVVQKGFSDESPVVLEEKEGAQPVVEQGLPKDYESDQAAASEQDSLEKSADSPAPKATGAKSGKR
jgi:hypothetical protein